MKSGHVCYIFIIFVTFTFAVCLASDDIRKKLHSYEVLLKDDISHRIVKRAIDTNVIKELQFKALERDFRLMLTPRKGILSSHFRAYSLDASGKKELVWVDHDNFYEGRVYGEKRSDVSAHYEDGILTATIQMLDDTYVIEPAWRHIRDKSNDSMIAYRGSDVINSWDHDDFERMKVCGYVWEGNEEENVGNVSRVKRQHSDVHSFDIAKSRCPLLLVADYRFYQNMGGRSEKNTINYLVTEHVRREYLYYKFGSRQVSLVDRVHKIYVETEWRDHSPHSAFKGMGFIIEEIHIHKEPTNVVFGQLHYNMEKTDWNVRDLLEVFSREQSHRNFCLAHLFTDIKFDGGILGLAYVGSSRRNSVGGICTPEYFKNGHTLFLNSGLSSSRNHYGQRVITREADLVTAHEFGHNWGSEHDPDNPECSPDSRTGGSYLMYTYSVRGYDINNKRFSPCSLRSIHSVLLAKSSKCFKEAQESFCGNSRVEADEECDVGLISSDAEDDCCDKNCRLKRKNGAKCSDQNSPCCRQCQLLQSGVKCRDANPNTCEKESRCTASSAECPQPPPEDDDKECVDKGRCSKGQCVPFCETMGLQSCMCESGSRRMPHTLMNACKRCCRQSLNATCTPVEPVEILVDGTPCINGFCNAGICEKTVQDIIERFWDIIEDININTVLKLLNDNIVATVIMVSAIVWIPASCAISYVDRKRAKEIYRKIEWMKQQNIMAQQPSVKKVIRISRSSQSVNRTQVNQLGAPYPPLRRTRFQGSAGNHTQM